MHFLLSQVLTHLDGEGVQTLNLGLSPLSGLKDDERDIPKALLRSIRFLGSTYYSFQGLEQFKGKFKPEWGKRWLLVSGVQANIIRVSRDIESVSRYEPYGDWRMYVSTLLGVVVLTLSLYLVLG
jgi:phosphatidylglycerol lysyltransferase